MNILKRYRTVKVEMKVEKMRGEKQSKKGWNKISIKASKILSQRSNFLSLFHSVEIQIMCHRCFYFVPQFSFFAMFFWLSIYNILLSPTSFPSSLELWGFSNNNAWWTYELWTSYRNKRERSEVKKRANKLQKICWILNEES